MFPMSRSLCTQKPEKAFFRISEDGANDNAVENLMILSKDALFHIPGSSVEVAATGALQPSSDCLPIIGTFGNLANLSTIEPNTTVQLLHQYRTSEL